MMKETDYLTFPNLTTDRLRLGYIQDSDSPAVFLLKSDDNVNKYLDRPKITNISEAKNF